jgi:hypothetical protein
MKNFLGRFVGGLVLASILLAGVGSAQAEGELLFGQNHSYSVVFRGNGEAIVYARIAFTNSGDTTQSDFTFSLPSVTPSEMTIYQMKLPRTCLRYDATLPARPCVEYREPDYSQKYYYGSSNGQTEYQKIKYIQSGNFFRLTLATPVAPNQSAALVLAYASKGYARESAGLFKFNFETLKVSARVQDLRVAVDVDSDLILKGSRAVVNYNETTSMSASDIGVSASLSSATLDKTVSAIGRSGSLVKDAKNLSPNESFSVRGQYAAGWFRLYLGSILLTILIIALILVGGYLLFRWYTRRAARLNQSALGARSNSVYWNLPNLLAGFGSAALAVGFSYLLLFLAESRWFSRIDNEAIFVIVGVIVVILLYCLIVFGAAIFVAQKHGWKAFVFTLATELGWFIVFLLIYLAFFASGWLARGGQVYY